MDDCSICIYICVPWACLVPEEARRRYQIPCNWSDRQLWAMWMLGMEPGPSEKAASLNSWAISPALVLWDGSLPVRLGCLARGLQGLFSLNFPVQGLQVFTTTTSFAILFFWMFLFSCAWVLCLHARKCTMCVVPNEARKQSQIPWSYRQL